MEKDIAAFVEDMQTPPSKLSVKSLREREEVWRALWSWIDEDVKFFVLRAGSLVRLVRRDYKASVGTLLSVKFDVKQLEVEVYEKQYNYDDGKYYNERKVVRMPFSVVAWPEFITDQVPTEAEEPEAVDPVDTVEGIDA